MSLTEGSAFQVQLTDAEDSEINPGGKVIFNDTIVSDSTENIKYTSGVFEIKKPGKYLITWWITTKGGDAYTAIKGDFKDNPSETIIIRSYAGGSGNDQGFGNAIIDLSTKANLLPFKFSLINDGIKELKLVSKGDPLSSLTVSEISAESCSDCSDCSDKGQMLQLELNNYSEPKPDSYVEYCDSVKFNNTRYVSDNAPIFNIDTGKFTITKSGKYLINWWVATQTVLLQSGLGFAIVGKYKYEYKYRYMFGTTAIKTGQVNGQALLDVENANSDNPYEFLLINITGSDGIDSSGNWQPFEYGGLSPEEVETFQKNNAVYYAAYVTVKAGISVVEVGTKGCKGERGEQGPSGFKNGIMVKIISPEEQIIKAEGALPFNTSTTNTDPTNIVLDLGDHSITLKKKGLYAIDWWISLEGSRDVGGLSISIKVKNMNTSAEEIYTTNHDDIISGLMYGTELIYVNEDADFKVTLVNSSTGEISLTDYTEVKGGMRIIGG